MPFTANSTVRDVLNNPEAKRIVERHVPGASSHPQLYQALHMSLREVASYPESGLTPAKLEALLLDLARVDTDSAADQTNS